MHQLIDLGSCVSLRGRSDHGLVREHKLDLLSNMELNPALVWFVFHQLVPMGPLFHLVRCFPPQVGLGSARSQAGVGHALVGWFRCFRPFPPVRWSWSVSVGLRFSFPLPFQGLPAPGQVCWCVFLFPFFLAFPSRVLVK